MSLCNRNVSSAPTAASRTHFYATERGRTILSQRLASDEKRNADVGSCENRGARESREVYGIVRLRATSDDFARVRRRSAHPHPPAAVSRVCRRETSARPTDASATPSSVVAVTLSPPTSPSDSPRGITLLAARRVHILTDLLESRGGPILAVRCFVGTVGSAIRLRKVQILTPV